MDNLPTYSFSLVPEKDMIMPCFSKNDGSIAKYYVGSDFNEWFFASIGWFLQKHISFKVKIIVDLNLFTVFKGSKNWFYVAAQIDELIVLSINPPSQIDNLYNRFIQVILYNLQNLSGNTKFDNALKQIEAIDENLLRYYYHHYLKGVTCKLEPIIKCSLQQAIRSSKEHDGFFTRVHGKALDPIFNDPGNTIYLDNNPKVIDSLGLVFFFNYITNYIKRTELKQVITQCFSSGCIGVDAQEKIDYFANYLKKIDHGL